MDDAKFCPNTSGIQDVEFRPYMVECAYDYYMICTTSPHQRMGIQTVMCALGIEVILKSFNSIVTSNHGRLNETYQFNKKSAVGKGANAHDLVKLYQSLPNSIQSYLFDTVDLRILKSNKDVFTTSRYIYEANANTFHNNDLIKLTACLICKVVYLYSELGCDDPFIQHFDINGLYFSQVQPILWCS